jgi:hypothetical protein
MTTRSKDATGTNLKDNAPEGLTVTDGEAKKARHEGALETVKEDAKAARKALTDGAQPGEPAVTPYLGHDETNMIAHHLDRGVDDFQDLLNGKAKDAPDLKLSDTQIYGLLALERNGQNRTPYVKAMMKKLGLKADELPGGGPAYTNDLTSITDL